MHIFNRRRFVKTTMLATAGLMAGRDAPARRGAKAALASGPAGRTGLDLLPKGNAPAPVELPHFPDRLFAYLWRNWQLVPADRLARVIGAQPADLRRLGRSLGLGKPPRITADQQRRSCLTVIKHNWHLLPYEQLLDLLGWTPDQLAFTLREDDFLFQKLGGLKPQCARLSYAPPDEAALGRAQAIARAMAEEFPRGVTASTDPLFAFVSELSAPVPATARSQSPFPSAYSPRFCYSYFALYGDPLMEPETDPYPDGYLARLAETGVDGIWLQGLLGKLSRFPWDASLSAHYEERLQNLRALVARGRRHGIGVYLYLNEPRALPLAFFEGRSHLKGVVEGDHAALCTSDPAVQKYLVTSVADIARAVPDLAGFFSISASENLTNCWSHDSGAHCPRCGKRAPGEVIAEVNTLFHEGLRQAGTGAQLLVWDWGWADAWVQDIIHRLPVGAAFMSCSEWGVPIERGGVTGNIAEYSISAIGPGTRARGRWELARKRGLKTIAKIQAGNTWELSAVPYIPAVANVAQHAANLRQAGVDGLMLGWTLGGCPSPNLEVVAEMGRSASLTPQDAMGAVARRRFGAALAPAVVKAWRAFSAAFSEFPFGGGLYSAPLQVGPSNLLWEKPTGYGASMVGFPYDDLDGWRGAYPAEVFIAQLEKIAVGFDRALAELAAASSVKASTAERRAFQKELNVADAAAVHFRSAANQACFVVARRALAGAQNSGDARPALKALEQTIRSEAALARRLHGIQSRDSRIGFEASNQYYYVPLDLAEKILNCRDLLNRWLFQQRARWNL